MFVLSQVNLTLNRLRRHPIIAFWTVAGFITPILLAAFVAYTARPRYEAVGSLIINPSGTTRAISGSAEDRSASSQISNDQVIKAQISVMLSEDVIRSAIDDVGINNLSPSIAPRKNFSIEQASLFVKQNLSIGPENNSFVVRVSYRGNDGIISANFVNAIMKEYLNKRTNLAINSDAESFYSSQIKSYTDQMIEASRKLREFSKNAEVWDIGTQKKLLLTRRDEDAKALAHTDGEISKKESEAESIRVGIQSLRLKTALPAEIYGTTQLSADVKPQRRADDFSGDPPLINIKLYQQLSSTLVDRNFELAGLVALRKRQAENLNGTLIKLRDLTSSETQFESLQRDVNQTQDYVSALNKSRLEARVNNLWVANVNSGGAQILQNAVPPSTPYYPRPILFILIGLIAGLSVAVCVVYLSYLGSSVIRRSKHLSAPSVA